MSKNAPAEKVLDHSVWACRDVAHRGWIGMFTVKAGVLERVRDERGLVRLFPDKAAAVTAALWAHLHALNAPGERAVLAAVKRRHRLMKKQARRKAPIFARGT